ncbi:MAG: hypothetical protein JSW00_08115 [Thermoplasmata archaeon]|nr:MAG: hypothetical protein JSW00_08115 [Thermoplasmata archaeon]
MREHNEKEKRIRKISTVVVVGLFVSILIITVPVVAEDYDWERSGVNVYTGHGGDYPSGNVGIGTDTPGKKLDVDGETRISSHLTVDTNTFYVDASNNRVGIGIASPVVKLDIDTGSNIEGLRLRGTAETAEIGDIYIGDTGQMVLSTENTGDEAAWIEADADDGQFGFIIRESGDGSSSTAYANLYVTEAGTTDYLNVIVGSGTSTTGLVIETGGNVGIGTADPDAKLEVAGAIKSSVPLPGTVLFYRTSESGNPSGSNDGFRIRYDGNFFGTNSDALLIEKTDANQANPDGGMAFVNTGNDGTVETAMVIRGDGKVGIGRTNPLTTLHVETSGVDNHIRVQREGYDPHMDLLAGGGWVGIDCRDTFGGLFTIYDDGTQRFHIDYFGNIGIGQATPLTTLHLKDDDAGIIFEPEDNSGDTDFWIAVNDDGDGLDDDDFCIGGGTTVGNNRFITIDTYGNVGIGTIGPSAGLDVQKDITASGGEANGVNLEQTLSASNAGDILTGLNIEPTFSGPVGPFRYGLYVEVHNANGIYSKSSWSGQYGVGVMGEGDYSGVHGFSRPTGDRTYYGVKGECYSLPPYYNSGTNIGVYGYADGGNTNWAGYFDSGNVYIENDLDIDGDCDIAGTLSKGGGCFKIDHPLDPENKYLYHSFVESPDMMNVYNGNITLNDSGEAWIVLPYWFETLNRDFRYQLTPIGEPGPNLYIAEEIINNQFKIAGGKSGMQVSWQVTGIRQDPWAEKYRIPMEENKSEEEKGKYLHPELYDMPETMGISYLELPEISQEP